MREEITEAVIRSRSAEKALPEIPEKALPEPPYQQSYRPKACNSIKNEAPSTGTPQRTPRNPPKDPLTERIRWLLPN